MNIKKASSKVIAVVLSVLMLVTAVYAGFATINFNASASTEYQKAMDCYNGSTGKLKNNLSWLFNTMVISDKSDPLNPTVSEVVDSTEYVSTVRGFSSRTFQNLHRTDRDSIPFYSFISDATKGDNFEFRLVSTDTHTYGAQYLFKSKEAKIYDFQADLRVTGNANAVGTVYYRVVAIDEEGNKTVLWPTVGNWYSMEVTAENKNPEGDISVVEFNQPANSNLGVECYAVLTEGKNIMVNFGAPAFNTIVNRKTSEKGITTTYAVDDYRFTHTATTGTGSGNYRANHSRVNWYYFTTVSGATNSNGDPVEPLKNYPFDTYYKGWSMNLAYVNGLALGYHHELGNYWMGSEVGSGHGLSYDFIVPYDGTVVANVHANGAFPGYFRVLHNDTVIYPANGGWADWSRDSSADTCELFKAGAVAQKGDRIVVQMYSFEREQALMHGRTQFTVTSSAIQNLPHNDKFGAALDVPYAGQNYVGEFVEDSSSIFRFQMYEGSTGQSVPVDTYDYSKGNFLSSSVFPDYGFKFTGNDLYAVVDPASNSMAADGVGASIVFRAPETSVYDISPAIELVSGSGNLNYRVIAGGKPVFPATGDFYQVSKDYPIVPVIVDAIAGEEIIIDYMVTDSNDSVATLNLGTVNVYKRPGTVASAVGFWTNYSPVTYVPKTIVGFNDDLTYSANRFEFNEFEFATGKSTLMTKYDSNTKLLSSADGKVSVNLNTSDFESTVAAGYGVDLKFVVPTDGKPKINMMPDAGKYRILVNGEVVVDWTVADGNLVEELVEVVAGDTLNIQFYSETDATIKFGTPSISYEGPHKDGTKASDSVFYPNNSNPYAGDNYVGDYEQKVGIWNFDTISVSKTDGSVTVAPTDYYNAEEKFLSNKTNLSGYIFGSTTMSYVFTTDAENNNGMSLRFISPIDDDQAYDYMFTLKNSSDVAQNLSLRVLKNDAQIWPEEAGWSNQTVEAGKLFKFPFFEFSANKGDVIVLQCFATDMNASAITLEVGTPYVAETAAGYYYSPDVEAKAYAAKNYNPYKKNAYTGAANLPESRWNFELFDVTFGAEGAADVIGDPYACTIYNYGWGSYLYGNKGGALTGYHLSDYLTAEIYASPTSSVGLSYNFVSPISGDVFVSGAPGMGQQETPGGTLYFRLLKNDTVVYPADGGWETSSASVPANFSGMDLTLEEGDVVTYQVYLKNPNLSSMTRGAYVDLDTTSVVIVTDVDNTKTKFSLSGDWSPTYQLSPYWKYYYSLNPTELDYKLCSSYIGAWGIWTASSAISLGTSSSYAWFHDVDNWNENHYHGSVMCELTVPKAGYIAINEAKIECGDEFYARIRINGVNVWPETDGEWAIGSGTLKYESIFRKVEAGDKIQFERTYGPDLDPGSKESGPGWSYHVFWNPSVQWSKTNLEYSGAKDIYGGMDEASIKFFKELANKLAKVEFDEDFEAHKLEAEMPDDEDYPNYEDETSSEIIEESSEIVSTDEPTENESSEKDETSKTSSRRKKTQTIIIYEPMETWLIVLICVGGAIVLGGIVLVIILASKKKKKAAATANAEANAEAEASAEEAGDSESAE